MASFRFDAKDQSGANISGEVQADSPREAARQLQAKGLFVMQLKEELPSYAQKKGLGLWRRFFGPVIWPASPKASGIYFNSFATLLDSGITVREAALLMAERAPAKVFKQASTEMAEAAMRGDSIVSVTPRYPAGFPSFVVAMLAAGDKAGKLDRSMKRLGDYFERADELAKQYRRVTLYPKIVFVAFLIVLALMLVMNQIANATLPTIAGASEGFKWKVDPGQALRTVLWVLVPVPIAIITLWYGWRALMRVPLLRIGIDRLKMSLPGVGGMTRKMATSKWCSAMAMLYGAGTPLHEAMVVAGEASGNAALAAVIRAHASRVMEGETISSVMIATGDFPDLAIDLMTVGEKSGQIEASLEKVAEYTAAESADAGGKAAMITGGLLYLMVIALVLILVATFWLGYFDMTFKIGDELAK